MKTSRQIRYENARALALTTGPADFARKLSDVSEKQVTGQQANQIAGPNPTRGIGSDVARRIEQAYGKEEGWLDTDHTKNELDLSISGQSNGLSDEAAQLILCVRQLDSVGDLARKTFVFTRGLLQLSAAYEELQTGSARSQMLAETVQLMSPLVDIPGPPHAKKRNK
jgi:hypothetical protein